MVFGVILWHIVRINSDQQSNAWQNQSKSERYLTEGPVVWRFRGRRVNSWWLQFGVLSDSGFYSHIEAFAHALQLDENYFDNHGYTSSPHIPNSPSLPHGPRIRKVSALSDFAPVNLKVTRYRRFFSTVNYWSKGTTRHKKRLKHDKRNDCLFVLLRWPLLVGLICSQLAFTTDLFRSVSSSFLSWQNSVYTCSFGN